MKTRQMLSTLALLFVVVILLLWYRSAQKPSPVPATPIGAKVEIKAPLGLPPVPVPPDNPPTAETIALGRRLYYDPALSVDNTV